MEKKLNAVIGYPLTHSKSPFLHNFIYSCLSLSVELIIYPTHDIQNYLVYLKKNNIELTAVTMPFKERIMPYLDEVTPDAKILGAVNTVLYRDKKLCGFNTDVFGIQFALKNISLSNKKIMIIGAGGAARALGYYFSLFSVELFWLNRTIARSQHLQQQFGGTVITKPLHDIDIIVNATPLGMYPAQDQVPLTNYIFMPQQVVFDLIYNPVETKLLKDAKQANATILSGIDMFIGQAIKQVELWTEATLSLSFIENITTHFREHMYGR